MAKYRLDVGIVAGCLLAWLWTTPLQAAPTVEQMLQFRPRQANVDMSTPTKEEQATCEVKLVNGTRAGSSGWMLVDARQRPLRKFFDSDGDKRIDVWSYYKNGLEVYREIDSNRNNTADQYRWLNSSGMRWGVDTDEDGKIDSWQQISADEAAIEAFQAVMTKDYRRLQALFITEAELKALGLSASYIEKIRAKLQQAPKRFETVVAKLPQLDTNNLVGRVESAAPQCVPGESIGIENDLLRFPSRTILYEVSEKQHEWLQTGEMVRVNQSWRLLDVPAPGSITGDDDTTVAKLSPEVQKLMEQLAKIDASTPSEVGIPGPNPAVHNHNMQRAALIKQLLPKLPAQEQELWTKQMLDNYAAAATHSKAGDDTALNELRSIKAELIRNMPGTNLAGYATFRSMWSEYAPKLSDPKANLPKVQAEWLEKLSGFVAAFPKADDTPDALLQLAMGSEFNGKEAEAKRWYQQLVSNFPNHRLAPKAEGASRRLNLEGNKMVLAGKMINGTPFDVSSMRGNVVVVYYWASYCESCVSDMEKLKRLQDQMGAKGFRVVTVNLDDDRDQAVQTLQKVGIPGAHLWEGGMDGPLANYYGIMGLPNMFLIGKDGNVIERALQMRDLEDEVRKAL